MQGKKEGIAYTNDSQIGPEPEGNVLVQPEKGVTGQDDLPIGQSVQSPKLMLDARRTPHVHYKSSRVAHAEETNVPYRGKEVPSNQLSEILDAFKELAITQKAMLKHMENWSLVQSNSQTPSNKREEKEGASTSKNRSRPGKEPMGAEEAPESWYEPIRRPNFDEEVPLLRQSNVPKTQGTFRNEPHNDPLFEPTFGGQERETKPKNGFYMHDEYNYAHNYRAKRSYINPLFEPSYGWEEEPQRTQYRNEERYAPYQKPDRANYLTFKDLDMQGADFFPKRMEQKALNQNSQGRPWMAASQSGEVKPWLASKRNTPTSLAPPTSKKEYPPQKKAYTGNEAVTQGRQEEPHEQLFLVKGVPDWFLRKIKPELFQGYKDLSKANKTYKPPNSPVGQWVLVRDPKTKVPQMVPILTRTQKRKLQRRYTLFQMEELPPKEKMWRETKPNPRFNRVRNEESEDFVQKDNQHLEEKPLMEITAAMDDDEGDQNLASPNSLASYRSGLLEAMLVEQECREGSSSPMETSAIASIEAEVKGEEEQEQSCKEKVIQFGSIPEVQINMVQPSSMTFISPDWSPTPLVSQPNEGPLEIIEISSSEELEAWEEMQESKEAEIVDGSYDILILNSEIQDSETTSKEAATEMYKPEIVPLSELTQATTHPTSEMDSGELVKLKAKLKQAVSYESDTPTDDAWM
ncbi:hypothetical protein RHGRI_001395 [Rhododendron griersonianum]|uniref:Uncharacterized protein n=1 Tax=Rhododendron griersonianum TaxID=479676 RepID=A0AAV6LMJ3_9ERIC|nr:hypothetical protein RHGRI_001395 [Rhododendron griersonianum]